MTKKLLVGTLTITIFLTLTSCSGLLQNASEKCLVLEGIKYGFPTGVGGGTLDAKLKNQCDKDLKMVSTEVVFLGDFQQEISRTSLGITNIPRNETKQISIEFNYPPVMSIRSEKIAVKEVKE